MKYQYKEQFSKLLVEWFQREKRDLPWRRTNDAYKIWVSEIMLQQTRVDTVIPYYNRFLEKYPDIYSLADAPEEELLKMWEGLGYYSRARNLQAGVREVVEKYNGVVPNNRSDISKLKGIGPYTAGAILSIAYNKPEHAVDGNVMRVLSRVLHITEDISLSKTRKLFEEAVELLIDQKNPGAFNQALMDLGAQICTPTSPKCLLCPVREICTAFHEGDADLLPVKTRKSKVKTENYNVYIPYNKEGKYLVEKRSNEGLLANMWQFPMFPKKYSKEQFEKDYDTTICHVESNVYSLTHKFSHLIWNMDCHLVELTQINISSPNLQLLSLEQIEQLPKPVPMTKILKILK